VLATAALSVLDQHLISLRTDMTNEEENRTYKKKYEVSFVSLLVMCISICPQRVLKINDTSTSEGIVA